ncbi:NAD(P)-binding protein [Aspergillus pseudotamarii]|uniref:NAD(P)-binding protein n=1 Tax=Aspergillus pseudotamarii TaxID=132259 RepID=A0A5N6T894_ASPPS|nr:NAD(P)-binding protein [Aspergillus pseudotamarii]KAE8142466.1 NAD(P)-binding protein [Aspergillus pseudotamarii]
MLSWQLLALNFNSTLIHNLLRFSHLLFRTELPSSALNNYSCCSTYTMSRIFITGATGYIGGDVLFALTQAFRTSNISALVRSESRASQLTKTFPSVTPVIGDLDSTAKITSEASEADVVLHLASSNHLASATAIAQGLTESKRQKPVWIQISGASLLSGPDITANAYGEPRSQEFNDLQGISEIRRIITSSPKRAVDNLLLGLSATNPHIRTAIIYGPLIYGRGRGPVNQRSIQLPDLAKSTIQHGHGLQVGRGLSCWSNVHVSDIAQLVVRLAQEASNPQNPLIWNENGIYFAENGKMPFGDISQRVSSFAAEQGFIKDPTVKSIDASAADKLTAHGAVLWGTNAQYTAARARELLGWQPQGPSLEEEIPRAVQEEASQSNSKL